MTQFENFAESPFEPLGRHMEKVKECVALVEPMFESLLAEKWDELEERAQKIFKIEHQADTIKNAIREAMPRSFSLPIFRGDLLAYLKLQDDIADTAEDIGVVLSLKNLPLPAQLVEDLRTYVVKVLEVCGHVFRCTDLLADLQEVDFAGAKGQQILDLIGKAEHAEWEADKLEFALSRKLFSLDDEMRATDIFLWSKVFQELGKLANHADKTAERLRRMLPH